MVSPLRSVFPKQGSSASSAGSNDGIHDRADSDKAESGRDAFWVPFVLQLLTILFIVVSALFVFIGLLLKDHYIPAEGLELPEGRYAIKDMPTKYLLSSSVPVVLAFILIAPMMELTSYVHARYMKVKNDSGTYRTLCLDEAQVFVNLLTGRVTAWVGAIIHAMRGNHKTVHPQIKVGIATFTVLFFSALAMLAGDIALHGTTECIKGLTPATGKVVTDYWGRTFPPEIPISSMTPVSSDTVNTVITIGNTALLMDRGAAANASFIAQTYGVTTTCSSMGLHCQVDMKDGSFLCPTRAFSGFLNETAKNNTNQYIVSLAKNNPSKDHSSKNFNVAMRLRGIATQFHHLANDAQVKVTNDQSQLFAFLECTASFQEWRYRQSLTVVNMLKNSTVDMALAQYTLNTVLPVEMEKFGSSTQLNFGADNIGKNAHTVHDIEGSFGQAFSGAPLRNVANMTQAIPNAQDLEFVYAASILKSAFYYFIASTLFFVFLFSCIWLSALYASFKPGVRSTQKSLTVHGMTAINLDKTFRDYNKRVIFGDKDSVTVSERVYV